jgi:hypothetical protein
MQHSGAAARGFSFGKGKEFNMRTAICLVGLAIASLPLRAGSGAGNAGEPATVSSAISEVTVYADRARVTRTANVGLRTGTVRFAFARLPGWLDEGSVRVALAPPASGELVDVQVERTFLAKAEDA